MPRRVLQGTIVSNKADKTVIVRVESNIIHPVYKKYIRRSKRYAAHDPENKCEMGAQVKIIECRPLSKTKTWQVVFDLATNG
ncbi:MAG: 30S ribosomal protein S17 [Alphaproteobacteria bacterium]